MMTTEPGDLIAHVLAARDAAHPDIPDDFLRAAVKAVEDAGTDADAAMRAIEAAVDRVLADAATADGGG